VTLDDDSVGGIGMWRPSVFVVWPKLVGVLIVSPNDLMAGQQPGGVVLCANSTDQRERVAQAIARDQSTNASRRCPVGARLAARPPGIIPRWDGGNVNAYGAKTCPRPNLTMGIC